MESGPALSTEEKVIEGTGASPGLAFGVVHVHHAEEETPPSYPISEEDISDELARLEVALVETRSQILEMQERVAKAIGAKDAAIFDAHLLVVEDQTLLDEVTRLIEKELLNIESIYARVAHRYATTLSQIEDPYLRERAIDIEDVTRRVIRNLLGRDGRLELLHDTPSIIVAENLTPADTATFQRDKVLGFATEGGSRTSHVAIMARSMGIPAVVGARGLLRKIRSGDEILLDGSQGRIILYPTAEVLTSFREREEKRVQRQAGLGSLRDTEATTRDGHSVLLAANIESAEDIPSVFEHGARGVGLFRTEFLFIRTSQLPNEDEQFDLYNPPVVALQPHPVVIRTLDIGGDKLMSDLPEQREDNPFLGWRAIRFCLEQPELFKIQLRAILRTSANGNVSIMYPMISSIEEIHAANALLEEAKMELSRKKIPFNPDVPVGMMMEVPSAAVCADLFAKEVDFFSIGTNDLIQYTIAVDRVNERVAKLYAPTHPGIVRLIKRIVDAGHEAGIWVGVCGEMSGDLLCTPLLIGLEVDELSTGAALVPAVKKAIQSLDLVACRNLAQQALSMDSAEQIQQLCVELCNERYPQLL